MIDYSRNWLFIDQELQAKLAQLHILIMGAGIGSVFAELALRTGIRNLTIADGDRVDASNLNRQNYIRRDIGHSKARSCSTRLQEIDPNARISIIDQYLDEESLEREIPRADIVINTIDFDSPAFLLSSRICRRHRKMELFPMNLGFGSSVCVFTEDSDTWEDLFTFRNHEQLKMQILDHLARSAVVAPYLKEARENYMNGQTPAFDPQLGISCMISASLMMGIILKKLQGERIQLFPDFYYLDSTVPYVMSESA